MGKIKSKKFLGSSSRNNPTNLTVVCNEEDLENAGEDVWQRITQQLQSGKIFALFFLFFIFWPQAFTIVFLENIKIWIGLQLSTSM